MQMPAQEIIVEKLLKMKEYIHQLKVIRPASYEEYLQSLTTKYAVERLLQLIVDLALDINNIILSYKGKPAAAQIAPSSGLRNRLVHEYEEINNQIVYNSIEKTIDMYVLYMKEIKKVIQSSSS
jgi:uncharacterized protein YutE (UPF0331/DUF86 family)